MGLRRGVWDSGSRRQWPGPARSGSQCVVVGFEQRAWPAAVCFVAVVRHCTAPGDRKGGDARGVDAHMVSSTRDGVRVIGSSGVVVRGADGAGQGAGVRVHGDGRSGGVGAGVVASGERRGMAHGCSDAEWQPDRGVCGREHCRPEHGWDRGRGAGTVRWIAGYMQCWVSGGSDERTVVELLRRGRCGCAAVRGGADGAAGDAAVRRVSAGIDP